MTDVVKYKAFKFTSSQHYDMKVNSSFPPIFFCETLKGEFSKDEHFFQPWVPKKGISSYATDSFSQLMPSPALEFKESWLEKLVF